MGINNLKVSTKIHIITLMSFLLLSSVTVFLYNGMSKIQEDYKNTSAISNLENTILMTIEQGLQSTAALRGVVVNPLDQKARDNYISAVSKYDSLIKELKETSNISKGYTQFEIDKLYDSQKILLYSLVDKLKNTESFTQDDNSIFTEKWRPIKSALTKWRELNQENIKKLDLSFKNNISSTTISVVVILLLTIVLIAILIQFIAKNIVQQVTIFQNGLFDFFRYLNKDSASVLPIKINSKDEFGQMAAIVNENIQQVQNIINQDNELIEDAKIVMKRVNNGWYSQYIESHTQNTSLEEFKDNVNKMIKSTRERFVEVDEVLEEYAKHNYISKLTLKPNDEKGGVLERLVIGINGLQGSITQMLVENKSNGLTLEDSSKILLTNVDKLNASSNTAVASLEETAAALEEITSNIRNNTQSIFKMSTLAQDVTKSVKDGEVLATETVNAMQEINNQVQDINDAIAVIDQIAFQTNILSLNAAVEAATAGEAGRGFAVVAQEVRNLASRSADAAKEIKNIVEQARNKADVGKTIANNMIIGYGSLNQNITQTIELIENIEHASKEQLQGIEQINDAVNALDQQTQQNAVVALQSHEVAVITDSIAKLVVKNANEKEFIGKNAVLKKELNIIFEN
ncbi:MAG: chemotaxis protein [Aliarcobacter sp.]|nr:chemotaxis protein [Aliarcobacter sp.]MBP6712300.1 chemotaxis protein [Aliarcobacter sp.]MBP7225632.1 chemotaxis protein [Aliarcobacter sp.]